MFIWYNAGGVGAEARITEIKRVKINRDCRKNPVYLMWKNSLGGWDFWLFDNKSENTIKTKAGELYDIYNEDIEREVARTKVLQNRQLKNVVVGDVDKMVQLIMIQLEDHH